MPPSIPTTEPTKLTAGTSWAWDRTLSEYPASEGWTLRYALRGSAAVDITATAAGEGFEVRVGTATTDAIEAGSYRLIGYVEQVGERHQVFAGRVEISANWLAVQDGRSQAERELAAVDAVIEGRITADVEHFMINGRQVSRLTLPELVKLRGHIRAQVRRERSGGQLGQWIVTRIRG